MNLALLLHYITVFMSFFDEIKSLINRIYAELDNETTALTVNSRTPDGMFHSLSKEFLDEIQKDHSDALVALETCLNMKGEVVQTTAVFGNGSLLRILPWLVDNREIVDRFIALVEKIKSGDFKLDDLLDFFNSK